MERGRATVDDLIARGELERIHADAALAARLLEEARLHLESARATATTDVTGSFQLTYDSTRKALAATLQSQGLRGTSRGGHKAIEDAFRAQFGSTLAPLANGFGWLRVLRNATEYPSPERAAATADDLPRAQQVAADAIDAAARLVPVLPVY